MKIDITSHYLHNDTNMQDRSVPALLDKVVQSKLARPLMFPILPVSHH
jgi:hypothetical protein